MTHEEFKAAWDKTQAELRALLQKQSEEIREHGGTLKETRDKLTTAEARYTDLLEQMGERISRLEVAGKREEAPAQRRRPTPGEIVLASDIAKGWTGRNLDKRAIEVGSFTPWIERKTVSSTQADALIQNYRDPMMYATPDRPLIMRDLLRATPISTDTVEYVEETGFYQLYTQVATQGTSGESALVVDNAQGFYPGQTVTIHLGTGAIDRVIDTGGVNLTTNTLTFTATLGATVAVDIAVTAATFVYTPEAQLKPMAHLETELKTTSVKTLAHWVPVTRQVLADAPRLQSYINGKLLVGLGLSEEQQILYGNNTSTELQGICTHSDVNTYLWSTGSPGDSKIDAMRRAMTLSMVAQYPVDGIIVNPYDWEDIQLAKDDAGRYIWVDVQAGGSQMMWRVPVVVSTAMANSYFLMGSFMLGAQLYDREQSSIRVSDSHDDFFARNMIAILAEERMALAIERPASFVYGQFDSAPAGP